MKISSRFILEKDIKTSKLKGVGCKVEDKIDYEELAKATSGYNGAEILINVIKGSKSITQSCRKQIEDMEKLFLINDFNNASKNPYWLLNEAEREKIKTQA